MKPKKLYTSEEKTIILREHLENNVPISKLAEEYNLHPNALYNWKKQLFEQAPTTLTRKTQKQEKSQSKYLQRITELENKLRQRESLIAELVEDNINLKKNLNGENSKKNGSNRM